MLFHGGKVCVGYHTLEVFIRYLLSYVNNVYEYKKISI